METPQESKFEKTVRAMSAKEIILSMVESLRKPTVKINMNSYGSVMKEPLFFGLFSREVCYGCAATNTICRIANIKLGPEIISSSVGRAVAAESSIKFLSTFENAIDALRTGDIERYNMNAEELGFATIVNNITVTALREDRPTEEQLNLFERLANSQPC